MLGYLAYLWWTNAIYGDSRGRGRTPPAVMEKMLDEAVTASLTAWVGAMRENPPPMVKKLLASS